MWILISKKLYDANKTISEQQAGPSVDLSKYYWYNTDTKKTLPATEIPQTGVVDGQPIDAKTKGKRTDISQDAINTWFDSSKEILYDNALSQLNISMGSDIGEFYRLASQYGISTLNYGEEGSIYKTTDEIKNKIAGDLIDKITNNAFTDKNLVEINKVQNESIDLLKFKTQGPVVTIFKGNAEKDINQSEITQYLQQGWATSKGVKTTQTEPVTEDKVIVYRDDEQKEILLSDLSLFEAEGWSTTKPEEVVEVVTTTTETVGISNDWNTDGSNIVNLNGKRYALFAKGNSFRSAGSEEEFNEILNSGEFTPIGNQNPVWLNFVQSENLDDIEIIVSDDSSYDDIAVDAPTGSGQEQVINPNKNVFNNIPDGADLVDVEGQLYLRYAVPGAGELYEGSSLFMFYEVKHNDPIKAGFVTPGQEYYINAKFSNDDLDLMGVVAGNSADLPRNGPDGVPLHPFTSFVETISTEATIKPWILDPDSVSLLAEAALENREVTEAEWFGTNWYKEHTESERNWLREYYKDPGTATQKANDYKIQVASALKAAGVSGGYDTESNQELGAPDALSTWIANKWVTGSWSESYTTEQLALFADPFRNGVRDSDFTQYINTAGLGGLNRSAEQEDRIQKLYTQYLGPVFGGLTDTEIAEKAGRLRNNPDYEQALVESLKTSRLALFPKYTNPELTYDDIVTPWRGLTRQVWGQEADETQGWWQDMVATNDYEAGQELLRTKGLEQDIGQVTVEATQALQQALGGAAGSVETRLGVNE